MILLASGYLLYSLFDYRFAILLAILTLALFYIGQSIPEQPKNRILVISGVAINLGVLIFFKYNDFFLNNLGILLVKLDLVAISTTTRVILPIGISFYTFQGISYIVEIHRKKIKPASLFDLALYLGFFPKLIAGPLITPVQFMAWLAQPPLSLPKADRQEARWLILRGLVKKLVIADSLASLSDVAFRAANLTDASQFPPLLYWQGFYLYAIEIYVDFSGYTDLARGSALLLGLRMPENFRQPYHSSTISDFWNRWHMSLTQWFREYLFYPLSRLLLILSKRRWIQAVQLVVNLSTMLIIGWWHGAALTYITWGAYHGILLSFERLANWKPKKSWQIPLFNVLTFHLVAAGWVLFRASSFQSALNFFTGMFNFPAVQLLPGIIPPLLMAWAATAFLDGLETGKIRIPVSIQHAMLIGALILLSVLMLLNGVRGDDPRPFIYGKF